jgi:DNA primase
MMDSTSLLEKAMRYQSAIPARIREYLNGRGIPDPVIDLHMLGWNGHRITIPIFDQERRLLFFRLAKDPEDHLPTPKMLTPPNGWVELYGWERLKAKCPRIVICEGEFDRLVLEGQGIGTVTSTGGAGVFKEEWAAAFQVIPEVYLCFDQDMAGDAGVLRVGRLIPHAKVVNLPDEVGEGGDVTDFFVRLGKSREDFLRLLEAAKPIPAEALKRRFDLGTDGGKDRTEIVELKARLLLTEVATKYLTLQLTGDTLVARCPFHEDHSPSFVIFPRSQTFYCFGCQARGDVLSFLMRIEQVGFRDALDLARRFAA